MWQILPSSQETEEQALVNDQMAQVIATDEASTDGIQQIIYVSYQDPDDPNQSRTLHFGTLSVYILYIYMRLCYFDYISRDWLRNMFVRYY